MDKREKDAAIEKLEREGKVIADRIREIETELEIWRNRRRNIMRAWVDLNPNGDNRPI